MGVTLSKVAPLTTRPPERVRRSIFSRMVERHIRAIRRRWYPPPPPPPPSDDSLGSSFYTERVKTEVFVAK